METIIILAYSVLAIYSGWKMTTNRIPALNKKGLKYRIGKIAATIVLGYLFAVVYLLAFCIKLAGGFRK